MVQRHCTVSNSSSNTHTLLFIYLQYPELKPEMQVKWKNYETYVDGIVSDGLFNAIACR